MPKKERNKNLKTPPDSSGVKVNTENSKDPKRITRSAGEDPRGAIDEFSKRFGFHPG